MKIHLISPRLAVHKGNYLGSGIPYWPAELAVFAGFLRKSGYDISVTDLFGLSPSTFSEDGSLYWQGSSIASSDYVYGNEDLFILYAISYMSLLELESIINHLKGNSPNAQIAVLENSQAVTAFDLNAEGTRMFNAGADFLILGEPFFNWDEIMGFVRGERKAPCNVRTAVTIVPPTIQRLYEKHASYPIPAWDLFPIESYWSLPYSHGPKLEKKYFPILTSRGCPWPCDFCVVPQTNDRRWRGRPQGDVVDEIISLRNQFGVNHFQIEDLNPTVSWPRFAAFCRELITRKADITFSIVSGTKAETIPLDGVALLAQAGCRYLSISPESGSKELLNVIGKKFDQTHAEQLVAACRRYNVKTQACFLVGHPHEQERDFKKSCDYMRRLVRHGLDEVAVFVVAPFAGSSLHQKSEIALSNESLQPTFGPSGRAEEDLYSWRRATMLRLFFYEKLKCGVDLWIQAFRALAARPKTKMENLPKRVFYLITHVFLSKCRVKLLTRKA